MLATTDYNRAHAVAYAHRWATERNPLFKNYTGMGGNCTNYVSQCLLAGCCQMNFTPTFGWYYLSAGDRTASWTGVRFLYNFLTNNKDVGPFGTTVGAGGLMLGDIIQLGRSRDEFYHTLVVTGFTDEGYLVSANTDDAKDRPLDTYTYNTIRYIHIEGVRIEIIAVNDCFDELYNGTALPV